VKICQLIPDLDILPFGDQTEIGEKGINLSGGQKARISIARAIYAEKEIILLDDPLAALDSTIKAKILEQVICGKLKNKTRILVTHDTNALQKADRVIVMAKGKIQYFGEYSQLKNNTNLNFINEILSKIEHENENSPEVTQTQDPLKLKENKEILKDKLTKDENDEVITVGWNTHKQYFLSEGSWIIYLLLIPCYIIISYLMIYTTYYQAKWVEDHQLNLKHEDQGNFWFYFLMALLYPVSYCFMFAIESLMIAFSSLKKSKTIQERMINRVLKAPINLYFDRTPSGIIINRFSNDINEIDSALPK